MIYTMEFLFLKLSVAWQNTLWFWSYESKAILHWRRSSAVRWRYRTLWPVSPNLLHGAS